MTGMRSLMLGMLVLGAPAGVAAQGARIAPASSVLFRPAAAVADSQPLKETYWKEGALIGGIPVGILGYIATDALCNGLDDSANGPSGCAWKALGGAAVGFIVGAIPGALIGGAIEKHH